MWSSISSVAKKKFNFNLDREDLYDLHLPRLVQTILNLLNIKAERPLRDISVDKMREFLEDIKM